MNTNSTRGKMASVILPLVFTSLGLAMSLVALLSAQLGLFPWEIRWWDSGALSTVVLSSIYESRLEFAAAGLVALNFMLLFLRRRSRLTKAIVEEASDGDKRASITDPIAERQLELMTDDQVHAEADDSESDQLIDTASQSTEHLAQDGEITAPANYATSHCNANRQDVVSAQPARNADAQIQIATDEIGRLRRELVSCKQQLEAANQTKAQFLANMSHELRTPMNGIMGMTDLLLGGTLTAREERFVRSISSSAQTLLAIINDLLDFSRINSGSLQLEYGRFSVRDCVEDVCMSLAGQAHMKNIELICYVDDNVPKLMEGDPSRVRQILNNLISNAIAFTDEGEVVVRLSRRESAKPSADNKSVYHCDVQDTGIGISPELQLQLFEAFTQADDSNTRGHGGLGMGLAIARQLVSMMGGEMSFRSRLGEGTRFSFSMELENVNDSENKQTRRRSLHGAHVLVVDDNETNRTILFHQLSNWGLIVEAVESGKLALESLREAHDKGQGFDVLILDLHMPEMDGIKLAKVIQAEPDFCHIQSIMLTSAILQLDGMELQRLGIYKYVSKPARQSVLHDSLASLMPYVGNRAARQDSVEPKETKELPIANAKVLLVEDNPVNQDVAMGMLEQLGCEVELATDGADAVSKGAEEKYDIVLMDCQMPLMDGYEATRIIKSGDSINAPTPIIALTANAMEGDREKCLMAGMDDYVSKPVQTQMLSHMLEKWVSVPMEPFDKSRHSNTPALLLPSGSREEDINSDGIKPVQVDSSGDDVVGAQVPDTSDQEDSTDVGVIQSEETTNRVDLDVGEPPNVEKSQNTGDEEALVNMKAIDTIRGLQRPGKPDLLGKVLDVYFKKTPEIIDDMQSGLDNQDYQLISSSAHSLKSSSAYLGADIMSKKCRALEAAISSEDYADIETLITGIAADYERVEVALTELKGGSEKAA